MAESQTDFISPEEYDYASTARITTDDAINMFDSALGNIRDRLKRNLGEARGMTDRFEDSSVDEILHPSNVDHIKVRAKPLENPKVTVWLKECPIWANDAWRDYIYPYGLNAYNGKVTTVFDVRRF